MEQRGFSGALNFPLIMPRSVRRPTQQKMQPGCRSRKIFLGRRKIREQKKMSKVAEIWRFYIQGTGCPRLGKIAEKLVIFGIMRASLRVPRYNPRYHSAVIVRGFSGGAFSWAPTIA